MSTRTITIVIHEDEFSRWFDVFEGERYTDHLAWEEMIGQVMSLCHPDVKRSRFAMQTPEQYQARRERWRARAEEMNSGCSLNYVKLPTIHVITGEPSK